MRFPKAGEEIRFYFILVLIFVAGLSAACGNSTSKAKTPDAQNAEKQKAEAPIVVSKAVSEERELPSYIQATGSLNADESSDVAAQVSGQVISTPVNVGAFVRQGDVILRLNNKDAQLRLEQIKTGVRQAEAGVKQAEARVGLLNGGNFQASTIPEVLAANANYEQLLAQLKQAEANEKRYRELVESGDVAMVLYEQYRTQRDTARAQVNNAKQQLLAAVNTAKQSNQAIATAQAAVEAARSQVSIAEKAVADTVIRAPYTGYVSARPVAVGENITSASPILTLLRTNPLKLELQVAEKDVPFITVGMSVSLEVDAYKDRKFAGTVSAVNPLVNSVSRTATIEASVENNNNGLRPGMFATARIVRPGGNKGIFVPASAVYSDQNTQSYRTFTIQENVAKLRVVQIGDTENEMIQIVSGLNAGETVATSNLAQLYEGAKVEIP